MRLIHACFVPNDDDGIRVKSGVLLLALSLRNAACCAPSRTCRNASINHMRKNNTKMKTRIATHSSNSIFDPMQRAHLRDFVPQLVRPARPPHASQSGEAR